jgi:hypothetical protein
MKTILAILLGLAVAAAGAVAAPWQPRQSELEKEIAQILAQNSSEQLGTMTVADLEKLAGEVSVAVQKAHYVQRVRMASFMMPGVGQYMAGDPVGGTLFLAGDIAVFAGTVLGAYFLLPVNVQIGAGAGTGASGLDYLNTPVSGIKNAWDANSLLAYLPSVGVMAGGMLVKHLLGMWSSKSAAALARQNIADGKVTFEPTLFPLFGMGQGGMHGGMGMMMQWRY